MLDGKLRVLAKGSAQVPNYEAAAAGQNGRITHACLPLGPEFFDDEAKVTRRHAAFVKYVGKVIEVPDRAEYRRHLRDGDLYPADIETAQAAGVPFDKDFGHEHDDDVIEEHAAALKDLAGDDPVMKMHVARVMPQEQK